MWGAIERIRSVIERMSGSFGRRMWTWFESCITGCLKDTEPFIAVPGSPA